jgi:hypothetical protein
MPRESLLARALLCDCSHYRLVYRKWLICTRLVHVLVEQYYTYTIQLVQYLLRRRAFISTRMQSECASALANPTRTQAVSNRCLV